MNKKLSKVNRVGQEIPRVAQIVMFMFNHSVSTYPSLAEPMLWQLLAYRYEKKGCFPLLSAYYPYPLAAVITHDRGQERLRPKHSIDYGVNKGLVSAHSDLYSDLFK